MKYKIISILMLISLCFCSCVKNVDNNNNTNENDNDQKIENDENETEKNTTTEDLENNKTVKENESLKQENESLKEAYNDLRANMESLKENAETTTPVNIEKRIYLNELKIYNSQKFNSEWYEIENYKSSSNIGADGNQYTNSLTLGWDYSQVVYIEYFLDGAYTIFNGNFMLTEKDKSTSNMITLKILDDNDRILYEYNGITGGLIPQSTGDINIAGVSKLKFQMESENGNVIRDRILLYDSILK